MLPVKVIPLTQGQFAIIDPEDYELVSAVKWHAVRAPNKAKYKWYAGTRHMNSHQRMHQYITGFRETDHVNGNGLDNRRVNLRETVSHSRNVANQEKRSGCSSRFKGVHWNKPRKRWAAHIKVMGHAIRLGDFFHEEDAARAYDKAALKFFGEYARTNKMMGLLKDENKDEGGD